MSETNIILQISRWLEFTCSIISQRSPISTIYSNSWTKMAFGFKRNALKK